MSRVACCLPAAAEWAALTGQEPPTAGKLPRRPTMREAQRTTALERCYQNCASAARKMRTLTPQTRHRRQNQWHRPHRRRLRQLRGAAC